MKHYGKKHVSRVPERTRLDTIRVKRAESRRTKGPVRNSASIRTRSHLSETRRPPLIRDQVRCYPLTGIVRVRYRRWNLISGTLTSNLVSRHAGPALIRGLTEAKPNNPCPPLDTRWRRGRGGVGLVSNLRSESKYRKIVVAGTMVHDVERCTLSALIPI